MQQEDAAQSNECKEHSSEHCDYHRMIDKSRKHNRNAQAGVAKVEMYSESNRNVRNCVLVKMEECHHLHDRDERR